MTIKELIRRRTSNVVSEPTNARDDHAAPEPLDAAGELDDASLERVAGGANIVQEWEAVW
ncbi:MAG: hypothetical protein ABI625_11285 [bacterium]